MRDESDRLTHYVAVLSDISSIKDAEARLVYLAHHDSLTDLPNRLLFDDRVEHAITRAERRDARLAMLFVDLDHFKNINDNFGHPVGDILLRLAAERLQNCVRSDATVARIGGDEFTVLLEDIERPDDAALVADRILSAFHEPFPVENRELYISPSIGISIYPQDGESADALLRNADAAMYKAKERGRKTYLFYTRQLTAHVAERVELEQSLHKALQRDELLLHYQPQIDLRSGELIGVEALLRWRYSDDETIGPARFVPLAEECGLIWSFGEWVLEEACRQAAEWLQGGLPINGVAVNISASQINRGGFNELVREALEKSGLAPGNLELEVTEGTFVGRRRQLENDLQDLRELGVRVAIDDFGTGYSSMSQLKLLEVDCVKIDRSFVSDIPADPRDEAIVKALASMALGLGLEVVAEGIETETQREFLLDQGCRYGQGFLFSKPLPAAEFSTWAERGPRLKSKSNSKSRKRGA